MNKEAAKSKQDKKENHIGKAVGSGLAAYAIGREAPSRLLGYHKVYHGTSSGKNADSIRKSGLKKSKGGTGVSVADDRNKTAGSSGNVSRSKGHVYMTKNKIQGQHYTKGIFGGPNKENLVTARIPHGHYEKAKVDKLTKKLLAEHTGKTPSNKAAKNLGAMSTKSISPSKIEGSSKYKGRKQFATKKNLKNYLSTGSGKKRFATGVLSALGSAGAGGYAVKKLVDKSRELKK